MNPTIESYINHEFGNSARQKFLETLNNKPNLLKRFKIYAQFMNHLKTQMLRERILFILEKESEISNLCTDSTDLKSYKKITMKCSNVLRRKF